MTDKLSRELADDLGMALCSISIISLTRSKIYDILYDRLESDQDPRSKCHKCMRKTFTTINVSSDLSKEDVYYCPECFNNHKCKDSDE